jgi:DNA-binding MarR family transcriptional regulator
MDRHELSRQVAEYCSYKGILANLYADFAKDAGLSYFSLYVLYFIYTEGETCTQKAISKKTFLPKQTVNAIITAFLKQKMISLTETQDDRRVKFIRLTNSGKRFADKIIPKLINAELDAMGKLAVVQRTAFLETTKLYGEYFQECLQKAKGGS